VKKEEMTVELKRLEELTQALAEENEALIEASERSANQLSVLKRDFDNYKNRTRNAEQTANDDGKFFVIEKMLPILDTFDRAAKSLSEKELQSFNLVLRQFEKILAEAGVEEMEVLGLPFDPAVAEAVTAEESEEKDTVLEVYLKGYKFKEKVLRHAKVKVGI